jgi:hypothetical protein
MGQAIPRQMGADCKGFTDWGIMSGVPMGQTAHQFFTEVIHSLYPQPAVALWTARNAVGRVPIWLISRDVILLLPYKKYLLK